MARRKVWHGNTFANFNFVTEQNLQNCENKVTQKFPSIQQLIIKKGTGAGSECKQVASAGTENDKQCCVK